MSYCPSSSFSRQDFLPGISSVTDGRRINMGSSFRPDSTSIIETNLPGSSQSLPISSTWTPVVSSGLAPEPRRGQSIVYWPETRSIITAYGRNSDDTFTNEIWRFIIDEQRWEKMDIQGLTPKAACGCALIYNKLWFFGGINSSSFVMDLHCIDLKTLEVTFPMTTGDAPPPCAMPLVAYFSNYLIVWAGSTGPNLSSLHVLNTDDMNWECIKTDYVGRQGACGTIVDSTLYIYGASCPMSLLALDLSTFEFTLIPTTGSEPPHGSECLTMISVVDTIIAFENVGLGTQTKLYVYDIDKSNWLSYSVGTPQDSDAASVPRIVFYLPDDRKLYALCEENENSTHPISELSIGKSISALNQRLDLLSMLCPDCDD